MSNFNASYSLLDLANNPNIGVVISQEIETMSWLKSPFEPLVGKGSDRMIRSFEAANDQPFRPRLKTKLLGSGVQNNEEFNTNYDEMEILSQTVYPKIVGNSVLSPVVHYSRMQFIDFEFEAKDSLSTWMMEDRDKRYIATLSNDLTNCVVADATNGYKDTSNETSVQNAAKQIQKGDVLSVKAIRRAIFMARAGVDYKNREIYPLKPIRAKSTLQNDISLMHYSYIILVDTYGAQQLKNDEEWRDMQKYAADRGDKNNLFTGLLGMIDGCPVLDFGVWSEGVVGLLNSEVKDGDYVNYVSKENAKRITKPSEYADAQPVSIGFLVGASALLSVGSMRPNIYVEKRDAGRKTAIAMDRLQGIAKARFGEEDNKTQVKYKGRDFATIGIFYSKE